MKRIGILLALVIGLALTSCQVKTSNIGSADNFKNGVSYFQDKNTGEVFAVIVIRKQMSAQQEGIGLAHIPRADLTPAIVKQVKGYNPKLGLPPKK